MTSTPPAQTAFDFSETCDQLFSALSQLQELGLNVELNSTGQIGQQKVPYANFNDVLKVFRPKLAENGLALVQSPGTIREIGSARAISITSMLGHKSGQWIRSTMEIVCPDNRGPSAAQQIGSAITYGKRYAAIALLCMSTGENEDDDGYSADTAENVQQRQGPQISHQDTSGPNVPWQTLIDGRWQGRAIPGSDTLFADASREQLRDMWNAAKPAEKSGDKINPCVQASLYDALLDLAASRRESVDFMECLKEAAPGWTTPGDPLKFSVANMFTAFNAINTLQPL